jgi:ATP-dependent DNA helicase DinG
MARLGCDGAATLQLGSPFDYARQVELILDRGAGGTGGTSPTSGGSYTTHLAQRILHHVLETDGGAFVLFTSFSSLNAVASALAGPLAERGLPLLAQGRDGSRTFILDRFKENPHSVLLGAASFWQGVDVRGQSLRNVIITKLPFDPPDRPLTQARNELIESRGGNAFMEESLPRAIIRFKQGFGRLIRSATDHGRVVVLDSRLLTARYAGRFLRALPPGLEPRIEPPIEAYE